MSNNFWTAVRLLNGKTLSTLVQGRKFDIVDVTDYKIVFVPQRGKGKHRSWPRAKLEAFNAAIVSDVEISSERVRRDWPSDQNTSYAAAILVAGVGAWCEAS